MCVPSLNEIRGSVFELLCTQVKTYGGGGSATDLKPIYPRLSSGDITKHYNTLSISGMAELWFQCFEYYHAYRSGNTFNQCLCVVLEQSLWLT